MYIRVFDRLTLRSKSLYAEVDSRGPVVRLSDLQRLPTDDLFFECGSWPVARVVPVFGSRDVVGLIFSDPLKAPVWFGVTCT